MPEKGIFKICMNNECFQKIIDNQIEKFSKDSKNYLNNFYLRNGICNEIDYDFLNLHTNDERIFLTEYMYINNLIQKVLIEEVLMEMLKLDGIKYITPEDDTELIDSNVHLILPDKFILIGYSSKQRYTNSSYERMKHIFKKYHVKNYYYIDLKGETGEIYRNDENGFSFENILNIIFDNIETETALEKIKKEIQNVKKMIGLNVVPNYSNRYINIFKDTVINKFKNKDIDYFTNTYIVSKPNKNNKNNTYTSDTMQLFLNNQNIVNSFCDKEMYLVLFGNNDISKCFLTSEYLFTNYKDNENIDYINIVSGYIKSIEMLLYSVKYDFFHKKPSDSNKTMSDYVKTIDNNKFIIFDLKANHDYTVAVDCLYFYMIKIRNEFLHRNVVNTWNDVKEIRNNTLYLYQLLLGGCKLSSSFFKDNGVVVNNYEELYKAALCNNRNYLYFVYKNEEITCIMPKGKNYIIEYQNDGSFYNPSFELMVIDDSVEIRTKEDYLKVEKESKRLKISNLNLPEYVYINKDSKEIIWSKKYY